MKHSVKLPEMRSLNSNSNRHSEAGSINELPEGISDHELKMSEILDDLLKTIAEKHGGDIEGKVEDLLKSGLRVEIVSRVDDFFFKDESDCYVETLQNNTLLLNGVELWWWFNCYHSYLGPDGLKLIIEDQGTDLDSDLKWLLELLDLEVEKPKFPRLPENFEGGLIC